VKDFSDKEIIHGIKNNDYKVFHYLYDRMLPMIKRMVVNLNGTESLAEDVFQDALMATYRKIQYDNFNLTCKFSTYIYSVSRKIWLRELFSVENKYTKGIDLPDMVNEPEEETSEFDKKYLKILEKYIKTLSKDCQKILRLHFNNATVSEIQEIMKYNSPHHTMDRKYRCKKRLITQIQSDPEFKKISDEY
jgi:RNA polymerase sigma factor (sigma-70 family)